ncbi:MAG: adenylate/guanylate cyclase domain-containing protein [Myxococcaceae bacterium]
MPDATAPSILTPSHRPPSPFPKRWAIALGGVLVIASVTELLGVKGWVEGAEFLAALILSGRIGAWLEQRFYTANATLKLAPRLLFHAFALLGFLIAFGAVAGLVGMVFHETLSLVKGSIFLIGYYAGVASAGSMVIITIDALISATVATFRTRVALAVLSLVGWVDIVCFVVARWGTQLAKAVAENGENVKITVDAGSAITRDQVISWVVDPTSAVMFLFIVAAIALLPATISASVKFADAVMDRIRPLEGAFSRVGAGDRQVQLEVGGSTDFQQLARTFNGMVEQLGLAERMERAFGVYVSSHVLERIRSQHGEAVLPPSLRDATVFFADIRGFTTMSEKLPPETVVAFLNRYFEHAVTVIEQHDGYLNKFIGDAMVVVFNGPIDQPDHPERAVRCAIALQQKVAELNAQNAFPEVGKLEIGVGISTGPMTCGNVGSAKQMEYTVIGDTVNLAARLTSQAAAGEVLISEPTAHQLPASYAAERLAPMKVKGKETEVVPSRIPVPAIALSAPTTAAVSPARVS